MSNKWAYLYIHPNTTTIETFTRRRKLQLSSIKIKNTEILLTNEVNKSEGNQIVNSNGEYTLRILNTGANKSLWAYKIRLRKTEELPKNPSRQVAQSTTYTPLATPLGSGQLKLFIEPSSWKTDIIISPRKKLRLLTNLLTIISPNSV